MSISEKIVSALAQMDPLDDDQWTTDGAPKVEVVSGLVGETVKRQDIINAAPDFDRTKAGTELNTEIQEPEPEPENKEPETSAETQEPEPESEVEEPEVDELAPEPQELHSEEEDLPRSQLMTLESFHSFLLSVPKEDLEELENSLKLQSDEIGAEIVELQEQQKRIARAVSITRVRIKEAFPNSPHAHAIRSFIESQAASRAARVERRTVILKGLKPEELDPRAPIDAAMARKTRRGMQRPVRPLLK